MATHLDSRCTKMGNIYAIGIFYHWILQDTDIFASDDFGVLTTDN
jgi:hypothetical protein